MRRDARYGGCLLGAALLLSGCGAGAEPPAEEPEETEEETPHGYVEGAEETAEPQWRLVLADTDDGTVHLLDPLTEEITEVAEVAGVQEAATDGRFVYLGDGTQTTVLDSGAWAVDHGDHFHYYRAGHEVLGEIPAAKGLRAATDGSVTALSDNEGVRILDRGPMEDDGEIRDITTGGAVAVPTGGRVVVAGTGADAVQVLDREGAPDAQAELAVDCAESRAQAATRRGAVIGCEDAAVVVSEEDDALVAERIEAPDGAEYVADFHHRPTTGLLAGLTEDGEAWLLDLAEQEWRAPETDMPALAVSTAGEEGPVLVLGEDGVLRSYDHESGEHLAETELLDPPAEDAPPSQIWVDTSRAYVNDPEGGAVHEIDYADDLRLARTFDLDISPDLIVETGW